MTEQKYVLIGKDVPIPRLTVQVAAGAFETISQKVLENLGGNHTDSSQNLHYVLLGMHATVSSPQDMYVGVRSIEKSEKKTKEKCPLCGHYKEGSESLGWSWTEYNTYARNPQELASTAISYLKKSKDPVLLIEEIVAQEALTALKEQGINPVRIAEINSL